MELTGSKERFLRQSVSEDSQSDVSQRAEDNDQGKVDFEGIQVVVIEVPVFPANQEVIC